LSLSRFPSLDHLEELDMSKQQFDGWPTTMATASGDFPLPGTGDAAGEPEGLGDFEGQSEADQADWGRFFDYCDRVIVTALARQPIQAADREDCRQEIWFDLLSTRLSRFRGGSLAAWLETLARNKAIDKLRWSSRHPVGFADDTKELAVVDPSRSGSDHDRDSAVRGALAQLEEQIDRRSYTVFFLRSTERLPFSQIANALGLTPEQARARHHRAKARFRRILARQELRAQHRA
jgi:RNA polymerase sigma factor (sigma-70 family)